MKKVELKIVLEVKGAEPKNLAVGKWAISEEMVDFVFSHDDPRQVRGAAKEILRAFIERIHRDLFEDNVEAETEEERGKILAAFAAALLRGER